MDILGSAVGANTTAGEEGETTTGSGAGGEGAEETGTGAASVFLASGMESGEAAEVRAPPDSEATGDCVCVPPLFTWAKRTTGAGCGGEASTAT